MSYSITIAGHKGTQTDAESKEFEEAQAEKARAFVAELEGVQSATFSGGRIGTRDLRTKEPA
jgi:hypothetical protein